MENAVDELELGVREIGLMPAPRGAHRFVQQVGDLNDPEPDVVHDTLAGRRYRVSERGSSVN